MTIQSVCVVKAGMEHLSLQRCGAENSLRLNSYKGLILPRTEQAYPEKPAQGAHQANLGKTQSCR